MSEETPTEEIVLASEQSPGRLLELAVKQDLDVEKLERLMDLEERWRAQRAKEAYFSALAQFQAAVPSLSKDSTVDFDTSKGHTHYKFASLPIIKDTIQSALTEAGLTYRWEFDDLEGGGLTAICIITHIDGHSEKTSMSAPADSSGSKNPVQQVGSTMTYLQRYTLIGALGLTTADKDDDGRQGYSPQMPPDDHGLQSHPQTAPRGVEFDRNAKLGFGKHSGFPWKDVDGGYLNWLVGNGTGARSRFAQKELDARNGGDTSLSLDDLLAKVHVGLDSLSGAAAGGILDQWLEETEHKQVEDGSEDELQVLLGQLRAEFRVENPK